MTPSEVIAELRWIRRSLESAVEDTRGTLKARRLELAELCCHPHLEIRNGSCTLCQINFKEEAKRQVALLDALVWSTATK